MPHRMRFITFISSCIFMYTVATQAQTFNCSNLDDTGYVNDAFSTFEKDLFKHYAFGNDTIKTYRTFLTEVASLSIDLRKIPSSEAIELARIFKSKANSTNSIWVKLSEYEDKEAIHSTTSYNYSKKSKKEDIYTFNYRGGYIQCLKNSSGSEDFRDVVTILENDGNISTSLISQRIYYMTDKEILKKQVRQFVAFDIYYSILMVIEKAFK